MTLNVQMMTMVVMIGGGIYLGFALDTYRRLTRGIRRWTITQYLLEVAFWLIQTIILFVLLYKVNNGELRFYIFLACLLGYSMYQVLCKSIYAHVLEAVLRAVKLIFGWIVQAIYVLLVQPIMWLCGLLFSLLKGIWHIIRKLLFYIIKWLILLGEKILPEKISKDISKTYLFCSIMINKLLKRIQAILKKWG